jgi:cell division protein FtsI (penicillin-binding protein 3)
MQRGVYVVRIVIVGLLFLFVFGGLASHLYELQITRHDELYGKAREKYTSRRVESGGRGCIYDVNGNLLAGNLACFDVFAEPRRFKRDQGYMAEFLSEWFGASEKLLSRRFASSQVEVVVKREVERGLAMDFPQEELPGIRFVETQRRYYPKGRLAANILGFLGSDGHGATGLEQLCDRHLQPVQDTEVYQRDRRGRLLLNGVEREALPRNGAHVYLTIDEFIQSIVEEELLKMVAHHRPEAAYAIMANPRTGAIMAMAQFPSFDPNHRDTVTPEQWRNRIVGDGFEPGSIMKAVAIAGALDYGVVTLGDTVDCEDGYWIFSGKPLRDSGHSYGELRVWEVIQKSSNIGTAKISIAMGEKRLYQILRRFGFGRPTGIEFPGEAPGIFRDLRNWDGLSISRLCIGQGILVTPLQMIQAYCALANGGIMPQLHIIDRIAYSDTGEVEVNEPRAKGRVLRAESASAMAAALKTVTTSDGTARRAAVDGVDVAGKTGTAQKVVDGQYSSSEHISSFIGFVPANDPEFVLFVVADNPRRNGYYGGTVAAPVFSRIAEKTLKYLQTAPIPDRKGAQASGLAIYRRKNSE